MTGGDTNLFSIDPKTGEIYTAALLSYYTNPAPSIDVTACDSPTTGATPNCAAALTVNIALVDVNNFAPVCTVPSFNFNQNDQHAADTSIGSITGKHIAI